MTNPTISTMPTAATPPYDPSARELTPTRIPDRPDINLRLTKTALDVVHTALAELIETIEHNRRAAPATTASIELLVARIAAATSLLPTR